MKKFSSVLLMSALFALPVYVQEDIPLAPEIIDGKQQSSVPDYPNLGRPSTPAFFIGHHTAAIATG